MENPIKMDDLGGKPTIFGFIGRFSSLRNPCLNIDPRLDLAHEKKRRCEGIDELVISCPKAPWDVMGCQVATCFKALFRGVMNGGSFVFP